MIVGNKEFIEYIPTLKKNIRNYCKKKYDKQTVYLTFVEDDALQQLYLEFHRIFIVGKYKLKDIEHLYKMLNRLTYWAVIKTLRDGKKTKSEELFCSELSYVEYQADLYVSLGDIKNSIQKLPHRRDKEVISRYVKGYTRTEVMSDLNLTEDKMRKSLSRARNYLKKVLN